MTRRRVGMAVVVSCLGAVAGGAGEVSAQQAEIRIDRADSAPIRLGEPFSLVVERRWPRGWRVDPWDASALAPLSTAEQAVTTDVEGAVVRERRQLRAWAFALEQITVPSIEVVARDPVGGDVVRGSSTPWSVTVLTVLDEPAGPIELPGALVRPEPRRDPLATAAIVLGIVALAAGLGLAGLASRRRRRAIAADPAERARLRLASLEKAESGDVLDAGAFHDEAASIVRDYVDAAFAACPVGSTTREFLAAERTLESFSPAQRELLEEFLGRCDLVKFANVEAPTAERAALVASARGFIDETRPVESSEAAA